MLRPLQTIGAYMLTCVFISSMTAHAAIYFVATTGNDSNPGTEETPWRTVAYAAPKLVAGDTLYLKNGTYNEKAIVRIRNSGTSSAPIRLMAYPGHTPIIDFVDGISGNTERTLLIQQAAGFNQEIAWITIEGLTITHAYNGIRWYNCRNCTIQKNKIHTNYASGLLATGGVNNVIDRNIISNNGVKGAHGLYLTGTNYTVTNNLIYANRRYGIQLKGTQAEDPARHPSTEFSNSHNAIIANNVIAYQQTRSGIVVWGSRCNNARIENNIFYENDVDGGEANGINFVSTTCTGIKIRNNLAYASGAGGKPFLDFRATEGVHYMQSGNLVNADNPGFVNAPTTLPASPNFKLNERSPAIDKGLPPEQSQAANKDVSQTTTTVDFAGITRPQGRAYDIGAYEYSVGGDHQAPSSPILQVN